MAVPRRRHGDLEQEILAVLASVDAPMTPAEVREELGDALAYNTITTVLSRLFRKGEVTRELVGRAYAYRAVQEPAAVTAFQMRQLLDHDQNRAAVLTRFVGSLSTEDEALLTRLLGPTGEDDAS
ncbi:BlaI/MecI/CopY family transcriptional regulator [Actinopolymorpha pittospori]|uniref:Transcriptional regulator n=1 Tax=Actinopolymorpha pittospori TaxID=648752 RepID=A0A927MR65_9ACTN|nr:BlaI/MecI/CopY family transcriptional regulator [Actinopolymorpha pittospori]MBE1603388.1 putative transcriptional regulator [Actinopolymorpha pittospori]